MLELHLCDEHSSQGRIMVENGALTPVVNPGRRRRKPGLLRSALGFLRGVPTSGQFWYRVARCPQCPELPGVETKHCADCKIVLLWEPGDPVGDPMLCHDCGVSRWQS